MRVGAHRFHRDLPESRMWGYEGTVPGPTIETERGRPITGELRQRSDQRPGHRPTLLLWSRARPAARAGLPSDPTSAYPRSMAGSVRTDALRDLIGRELESERIATVVDGLPARGGALVLRGEPGIGKSALLRGARERTEAAGGRSLTTVGVESEAEFAFAGLHQLLHPVLGHAARLPPAQRRALDAVFGVSEEVVPDSFRIALATFQLLCDAAETGPILLIVDDAHWLDRSTLGVLTFVAGGWTASRWRWSPRCGPVVRPRSTMRASRRSTSSG